MNHLRMNVALLELFRKFIRFGRVSLPEVGWIGWDWVVSVHTYCHILLLIIFQVMLPGHFKVPKVFSTNFNILKVALCRFTELTAEAR